MKYNKRMKYRLVTTWVVFTSISLCVFGWPSAASPADVASNPTPANGAISASRSPILRWGAGDSVQRRDGHMVFIGTDRRQVADAFYRNHPNVKVHVVSDPTLTLSTLRARTTYYWRVDQVNVASSPRVLKGAVWSFTTRAGQKAESFSDKFDVDHDFLKQPIAGHDWDGFLGRGVRETADRIAAADGKLYLQSTRGRYQEGWDPLGPLLYKTVSGDFKATVRVVDYESLSFNNCGIMARAANLADAGPGEDWISVDYFPIYGGVYGRMADDNRRTEKGSNGQGRGADKFLQLELVGNLFFLRHSADGVTWRELPASPITRNDLVNVPLQVGLFQATYSDNQGQVSFDDFSLECSDQVQTARLHTPLDGAKDQPPKLTLSWIPGSGALYHDVYFGTTRELVQNADREDDRVYKGRQDVVDVDYDVSDLADGETYCWRVDEVTDTEIHRGDVWTFTIYDRNLENFENYKSHDDLAERWSVVAGRGASLVQADARSGRQAMKLEWNAVESPGQCQVDFAFPEDQDWLSSTYAFRSLRVYFKGDTGSQFDQLYMAFEDHDWGSSRAVVEYEGDRANLSKPSWTRWDIDLRRLVENNPTSDSTTSRK